MLEMIRENLTSVRKRIERAAKRVGRNPATIRLVVVTKEAEINQIREIIEAGITDIGENRVKSALTKKRLFDSHAITWHMIGHLQSNKVKDAVGLFSIIHSVDSFRLAHIIDKEAKKIDKIQEVLIETNVSGEETKFGIKPNELGNFLEEARLFKNINILGLMTMAPLADDSEIVRPHFNKLKELADMHHLKELSMGMTQDFEVGIEEGATMVRIGSAIFSASASGGGCAFGVTGGSAFG